MIIFLVAFPLAMAALVALLRSASIGRCLVMANAVLYLAAAALLALGHPLGRLPAPAAPGVLLPFVRVDGLALYLFLIMAVVNLCAALYSLGYLKREGEKGRSVTAYAAAYLVFDASMCGVLFSNHLALLWVFLEATTLSGAFLVNFERGRASLEATWKYLFICSIGIALAFVSVILLALSGGASPSLFFDDLFSRATLLDPFWLKMALAFALVGFGTKVGLAPMHAWLPDAHSEAPSPVSALLSGALLNAAFVPLFRLLRLMELAGLDRYARVLLVATGFLSVLICAAFAAKVGNYKRLLAYSSVENMGIIAIGAGMGGVGAAAALLHAAAHSFSKASLFLTAGNIYSAYGSKKSADVRGLARKDGLTAWIWLASFAAISGIPPFPSFLSKFLTVKSFFDAGQGWLAAPFLLLIVAVLAGTGRTFVGMVFGRPAGQPGSGAPPAAPPPAEEPRARRPFLSYAPQLILLGLLLALGAGLAGPITQLLEAAVSCV